MSKKPAYQIPFLHHTDGKVSMMEYTSAKQGVVRTPPVPGVWQASWTPDEWRDVGEFDAELLMTGTFKGRSAARVKVTNTRINESYSLGMVGFFEAVKAFGVDPGGIIRGRWTFRKQGSNYALHPVIP